MTDEPMYEITTQWGKFMLDERSYQDYLDGRSWLCAAFNTMTPAGTRLPQDVACSCNVSRQAIELRDMAAKDGVGETAQKSFPSSPIKIPYRRRMAGISIDELNLSVRASNGLMRAGVNTLGKLNAAMQTELGIGGIRNLGQKSVKEIGLAFLSLTYSLLSPYEKALYWQRLLDNAHTEV